VIEHPPISQRAGLGKSISESDSVTEKYLSAVVLPDVPFVTGEKNMI